MMKKAHLFLLTLLISIFTCQSYAQELRVIEHSDFRDTVFEFEPDFIGVRFILPVDFSGTIFNYPAYFLWQTRFDSIADFTKVQFKLEASFTETIFKSEAIFTKAHFNAAVNFLKAQFESRVSFSEAQFRTSADFDFTNFNSGTTFRAVLFDSGASFVWTHFDSSVSFYGADFYTTVCFFRTVFNGGASFTHAKFDSLADFGYAQFGSDISFVAATLPKFLDFSYITKIYNEIDLTEASNNEDYEGCYINLVGSAIDKFRFRYKRFKLWFPQEDSIGFELKASVYEELLQKQKDEGFTQSYEILDKEYREFQYTDPNGSYGGIWGHSLNWVNKNWWGYGYNKELIVRNVLLIFLFLSLANAFTLKHLTKSVYVNENIYQLLESHKNKNPWYRLVVSIKCSLFYTGLIFFGFRFDLEKLKYTENLDGWKLLSLIYFFIIYIGGYYFLYVLTKVLFIE